MKGKKAFLFFALPLCLMFGCENEIFVQDEYDAVSKGICSICSFDEDKQNPLALLLINAGQVMTINLPGYGKERPNDVSSEKEEEYSRISLSSIKGANGASRIVNMTDPYLRRAHITVDLDRSSFPDIQKMSRFYCEDCIRELNTFNIDVVLLDIQNMKIYEIDGGRPFDAGGYRVTKQKGAGKITVDITYVLDDV